MKRTILILLLARAVFGQIQTVNNEAMPTARVKINSNFSWLAGQLATAGPISSVFGRTGAVVATSGDYTYSQISGTPTTWPWGSLTGVPSTFAPINTGDWAGTWQTHAPGYFQTAISGAPGTWPSTFPPVNSGNWAGTWQTYSPSYFQTAISGAPGSWPSFGTLALANNPMTGPGDMIVGSTAGALQRLANPGNGTFCPSWASGSFSAWIACPGSGGGISSITWSVPSGFTITPSPLTANGTETLGFAGGQTPHQVLGTCGSATTFGPCALVAADIPSLSYQAPIATGTQDQVINGLLGLTSLANCASAGNLPWYSTTTHLWTCHAIVAGDLPAIASLTNYPLTTAGDLFIGAASGAASRLAAGALDTALMGGGAGVAPSFVALANCASAGGVLWYSTSTHTYTCHSLAAGDIPALSYAPSSHNLLSSTHGDTTASSAVRGGAIFAVGATPTWQQVAHSSATGGYYKWNGTDIVASTMAAAGTGACGANTVETGDNADAAPTCTSLTTSYLPTSAQTRTAAVTDLAPATTDSGLILVINPATAIVLTRVYCASQAGTNVVVNLDKRAEGGIATDSGHHLLGSDLTAVNTGANTSTFANGSGQCGGTSSCAIAAHAPVVMTITSISGSPTALNCSVDYTVN